MLLMEHEMDAVSYRRERHGARFIWKLVHYATDCFLNFSVRRLYSVSRPLDPIFNNYPAPVITTDNDMSRSI